jgi:hypothetical protein
LRTTKRRIAVKRHILIALCALLLAGGCSNPSSLPLREPRLSMPGLSPSPSGHGSPLQTLGINGQSPDETDTPHEP